MAGGNGDAVSFRARLFITFLLAVLVPMTILAVVLRREVTNRLTTQYERRVEALVAVIGDELDARSNSVAASLAVIRESLADDNRFRRAAVDRAADERRYLLDVAGNAMRLAGLSMLQIQDHSGRILSSGHFRNEYDRLEPALPRALAETETGFALVHARAPEATFLTLSCIDSVDIAGQRFFLVGGVSVDDRFLAQLSGGTGLDVILGADAGDHASSIARELDVPSIGPAGASTQMTFRVAHPTGELDEIRASIDRWLAVAVAATFILAILMVSWISSLISRPLVALAEKTSRVDFDRLDVDFDDARKDEVGILSRGLGAMTARLRASVTLIKDAERRATLGELARQVNHDVKNGLTPIRNVFQHLSETARDEPQRLGDVFAERRGTIDSGIAYLEDLASNYARLSPRSGDHTRGPCDVGDIVRRIVADRRVPGGPDLLVTLTDGTVVDADPLSLRRVLENLIDNAIDSLDAGGTVTVRTERVDTDDDAIARITVADTGRGMRADVRAKVFDDFFTTKEDGTGLGLSIVRRIVMDLGGTIDVESEPKQGSQFTIDLPLSRRGVQ